MARLGQFALRGCSELFEAQFFLINQKYLYGLYNAEASKLANYQGITMTLKTRYRVPTNSILPLILHSCRWFLLVLLPLIAVASESSHDRLHPGFRYVQS